MKKEVSFTEANATKYPEQIAIAIAKDSSGKYNPITLGWVMQTSFDPPMVAIAIGKTRYSMEGVRAAGEFVVAFPSEAQKAETMLFGTQSGRDTDKLAEAGIATEPAGQVDSVLLTDAVANFECKVAGEIESGDHVIFVGEVVCAHVNASEKLPRRIYTLGADYSDFEALP